MTESSEQEPGFALEVDDVEFGDCKRRRPAATSGEHRVPGGKVIEAVAVSPSVLAPSSGVPDPTERKATNEFEH